MDALWPALAVLALSQAQAAAAPAAVQTASVSAAARPTPASKVVRVFAERPDEYETGALHIVYSDGLDVAETVPATAAPKTEDSQAGFSELDVASDRQTVGWGETYWEGGQSYPVPLVLTLYRSGKILQRIRQGQMLWVWAFLDGANRVAALWGTTHGSDSGTYRLYDVKTGQMLAEFYGEEDIRDLDGNAPDWVKQLAQKPRLSHRIASWP
jgi:hypothetical protein